MNDPIRIDVWSDVACPWCYIGKRQMEAGISAFSKTDGTPGVQVQFHSFQLDPGMPDDFEGSAAEHLARHKGIREEHAKTMQDHVANLAADVGLTYDFATLQPANTLAAHQLLHLAARHGVQIEVKERLMRAHFTEGRHIGRIDELADIGAEAGIDRDTVTEALTSGAFLPAVQADLEQAATTGIRGVPFFVIDGRYGISGAQPVETFTRVLADVADAVAE